MGSESRTYEDGKSTVGDRARGSTERLAADSPLVSQDQTDCCAESSPPLDCKCACRNPFDCARLSASSRSCKGAVEVCNDRDGFGTDGPGERGDLFGPCV